MKRIVFRIVLRVNGVATQMCTDIPKTLKDRSIIFYHGGINGKLTNVCCVVNGKQNSACHVDGDLKGV
jgi:3-methyladenine DNA glycosylase Tag